MQPSNQAPKATFNYLPSQQNQANFIPPQSTNAPQINLQTQPLQYQQFQIPSQQAPNQQLYQQAPNQQLYQQAPNQQLYQQVQMPNQMAYQAELFPSMNLQQPFEEMGKITLLKAREQGKKIAAIIVTFTNGSSYDDLFRTVEQKTIQGTQVLVYACPANSVGDIFKALKDEDCSPIAKQLRGQIKEVHADCVVFNWECSSSYCSQTFTEGRAPVMGLVKLILDRGHMAMFSDFSLKALIQQWDSSLLGSNPFVRTGETSNEVILRFKSAVLKECPSAQLQIVGDMADGGKVNLHTLGSTILYSVDPDKIDKHAYQLTVLTINTTNLPNSPQHTLKIDEHKGSAGHILLKYKSGGHLLTSMGHWIELMKIDTSEKKLFEVAEKQYGRAYAEEMRVQYASMDVTSQKAYVQTQARTFVQNQAPCSNMNFKG